MPDEHYPGVLSDDGWLLDLATAKAHLECVRAYADHGGLFVGPLFERYQDGFCCSHGFGLSLFLSQRGHRWLLLGAPHPTQNETHIPLSAPILALSVSCMSEIIRPTIFSGSRCIDRRQLQINQANQNWIDNAWLAGGPENSSLLRRPKWSFRFVLGPRTPPPGKIKVIEHLQNLDDLIIEYTLPPAQTVTRNHLHLALKQTETQNAKLDKIKNLLNEQTHQNTAKTKQIAEFVAVFSIGIVVHSFYSPEWN